MFAAGFELACHCEYLGCCDLRDGLRAQVWVQQVVEHPFCFFNGRLREPLALQVEPFAGDLLECFRVRQLVSFALRARVDAISEQAAGVFALSLARFNDTSG